MKFQLTASQGGWLMYSSLVYSIRSFQLTASQGGWRSIRHTCSNEQHFNSQPHKEADTFVCHLHSCWTGISTHSLTRRLTFLIAVIFFSISISTHSLTRRLTQKVWCSKQSITHFNSQPHKEADQNSVWRIHNCWHFNSQPHKEADQNSFWRIQNCWHFNSQPHKEADLSTGEKLVLTSEFQLTASQGGWPNR